MKEVETAEITEKIAQACVTMNAHLGDDKLSALKKAAQTEVSPTGCGVLNLINENIDVAGKRERPICQDTGMVVAFVTLGQDVHIVGGGLEDAIQAGVRRGYKDGYLRKSVVSDPLLRVNTNDNTPAVVYYKVVPGDTFEITLMAKGFGSENTSAIKMLKPAEGTQGVIDFVLDTIEKGAPNACAPIVVGVGLGGTFEKAALLAKEALADPIDGHNAKPHLRQLEETLYDKANDLGIGPMGMGGVTTVLGVNIRDYPTHIAGLPAAVNICCYVDRHVTLAF